MRLTKLGYKTITLMVGALLALWSSGASAQTRPTRVRITEAVDETNLVQLRGNVHPLARAEFDQGVVADAMPANRMLLLLQRSPEQEAALRHLMDDQQNKASANFHAWLTPEQFGKKFGPADADIQTVTQWLASQGFQGIKVGTGRTTIEFSGNVGQVRNAFHTEIHKFLVNGEERHANVSDPQIPAALAPVVAGLAGLHNFPPKAHVHRLGTFRRDKTTGTVRPLFTFTGGICGAGNTCFSVGPTDFATIYNVLPLWAAGTDGNGQSIALVGDSNINISDVVDFRNMFGLPTSNSFNTPQVIVNGPDPGLNGDETEADLDVQWAGAVAKNAQIILVVTEQPQTIGAAGVDLSAQYIIDNNLAPVMSESFGICEAFANNQLESSLWQQASAQGITAMVSSGDNGSAGCDPASNSSLVATQGLAVSGVASTPFNVAVGGTDFNNSLPGYPSTYWNTTNTAVSQSSAKSYIPEVTWNDTCAFGGVTTACTSTVINNDANNNGPGIDIVAGSGGSSAIYMGSQKPSWQTGLGDANRDLPDVSLFAGNGANGSFYVICEQDANAAQGGSSSSCDLNSPFLDFQGLGGTSSSSPSFAGIMALVNQIHGRQGNANYVLYAMSKRAGATCTSNAATAASPGSCVFYDLPAGSGNISVACQGGSPQCSNTASTSFGIMTTTTGGTTPAYNTAAGWDFATGLGSVNVANLLANWASPSLIGTNVTLAGPSSSTIGASVTFSGAVTRASGTATPTGLVLLEDTTTGVVIDSTTLPATGTYTITTTLLPAATNAYNLVAHYGGDGNFAPRDSNVISMTVPKQNSQVVVSFVTFTGTNGTTPVLSTSSQRVPYGSPYILRVDVENANGTPCENFSTGVVSFVCPTGTIQLLSNGNPLDDFPNAQNANATNAARLNDRGFAEDQPIQLVPGSYALTATYTADANSSYNSNASSNTLSVMITQAGTTTTVTANPTSITSGSMVTLTATVATQSSGVAPGGALTTPVQFLNGTTPISGMVKLTPVNGPASSASLTATLTTTLSALGIPDTTSPWKPRLPPGLFWLLGCCALLYGLFLLKVPRASRRGYAYAGLVVFALAAAGIAGCGGGSSKTPQSKTVTITAKFVGDSNYTASSGTTTVTVQ
jgi:subtilase family serine protease